jgi:hypothetical protein
MITEDIHPAFLHTDIDPDITDDKSQKLIDNIHSLILDHTGWALLVVITSIYGLIFGLIFFHRNKPMIQTRSPMLLLIITFGLYFDSMFKIIIIMKDYG